MAYSARRRAPRRTARSRFSDGTGRRAVRSRPARRVRRSSGQRQQTVKIVLQTAAAPRLGDASVGQVRTGRAKF
nr:MAG: hypothetical protein [Microvirus sp.]